jgi:mRNA-degrading endonuclease toxin of MazEF toxin-antitoxin module
VVWSDDPFKDDPTAARPWLVVNNETHPFGDRQHMTVALTTSGHDAALPVRDGDWVDGGTPERSYVLPWAVHSPQRDDIDRRQGRLEPSFVGRVVEELVSYIESNA